MKKIKKCSSIKIMKLMVVMICAFLFFIGQKTISMADSTGKVKENAKVRQSADVNSEAIGGLSKGTSVTITNEVNDASGTLWYEISSGNTKGFVRSDLIEKSDSAEAAVTPASQTSSPAASGAEVAPDTTLDLQYATVKASKAKIRSKASTTSGVVDSMPQNTILIVSGQTNGSDGKIWYYVTFTGTSGSEKNGFVRSDLITLGDMVPVEEPAAEEPETPTEEPQVEEPVVSQDYQVVYEDPKNTGEYAWYLHDNTGEKATRQKVEELLDATEKMKHNAEIDAKTISKQRVAIVIMVALVIILAVALTFMFFKLRDAYIEEEEDDSDNWKAERRIRENRENRENREGRSTRSGSSGSGSSRSNAVRQEEPVRRKSTSPDGQQPPVRKKPVDPEKKAPAREVTYEDDGTARPKPAPKKKAKNFLADDDDFEFEFLNMKDKDKGDE